MKIVLPFYKIAYAVSFVVILSLIRGVVFTNEIGLSIEAPFAILTAVFCADTYVQEITSKRSEIHRLYPIRKRICSIMQRIMIQEFFLLLLAVLGYGLFFVFQKPVTHPATESEILQFIAYFLAIAKIEELEECNYNMIDNVLNNEKPKEEKEHKTGRVSIKEKLAEKKAVIEQRDKSEKEVPEKGTEKKSEREI